MKLNIKKISLYLLGLGLVNNYQMISRTKQFFGLTKNLVNKNIGSFYFDNNMIGTKILSKARIEILKQCIEEANVSLREYKPIFIKNKRMKNPYDSKLKDYPGFFENQGAILNVLNNFLDLNENEIKIDDKNFDIIMQNLLELKNLNEKSRLEFVNLTCIYFGKISMVRPIYNILTNIFGEKFNLKELFDLYGIGSF